MEQIRLLYEKRREAFEKAEKMCNLAVEESRTLTKEEQKIYDSAIQQIDHTDLLIKKLEGEATNRDNISYDSQRGFITPKNRASGENTARQMAAMFKAVVFGPKNEEEERALSTTDNKGGYTFPITLSESVIQQARAKTVAGRAGVQIVPIGVDHKWPKITTGVAPASRAEAGEVAALDQTYGVVAAAPVSVGGILKASVEALQDGGDLLYRAIETDILEAMNNKIDNLFLNGTGANNQPTGLITLSNTSGAVTLGTGAGGDVDWDDIITGAAAIRANNYGDLLSVIMNPRTWAGLGMLKEATTEAYLQRPGYVNDFTFVASSQVSKAKTVGGTSTCADMFIIDPTQFIIGIRSDIRLEVLKELYAGTLEYGFLCHARFDILTINNYGVYTVLGITN